ncbi:MAG: ABC transporter substrate-binding protein [Finegoldia sp.]|nr:ABC transporter substrate-binding protein [Finegoldia sp.]
MKKSLLAFAMTLIFMLGGCANEKPAADQGASTSTQSSESSNPGDKTIKVGILQFTEHVALDRAREGFIKGLEEKGYTVEETTTNVQGDVGLIPASATKFQADGVDVIYAIATPAAQGAMNAVKDIPIIFNAVTDAEAAGLVASNEKPGGNVTGVSDYFSQEVQLNNFLELFPDSKNLGVLYSTGEANSEAQIKALKELCQQKGITLHETGVATTNDISQAMTSLVTKIDSYVAIADNLASSAAPIISGKLTEKKIPSYAAEEGPCENGILFSDGVDYLELGKMAAGMADEIKNGKNPGDIPVGFAQNSKRIVNKTTAQAIGLKDDNPIYKDAKVVE